MNLFIQVENEQPVNHPAFEDNLLQAFGAIPENWEPFIRVERPVPNTNQVLESKEPVYAKVNGVWTDVWTIRDMTEEEKAIEQQKLANLAILEKQALKERVQEIWATLPNRENFSAWVYDEEVGQYLPPTPRPTEGDYRWDGSSNSWVLRT
jgi:hypothetical protein